MTTRALLVAPTAQVSGAETVLLRLTAALRRRGTQVEVACPAGPLQDRVASLGVAVTVIPALTLAGGAAPVATARTAASHAVAAARIRRRASTCDVVVVNGFLALPALRAGHPRPPVVWLVHDVIHRRSWRRVLALTAGAVDVAVACSDAVAAALRGAPMAVEVVRNGTRWPVEPLKERVSGPAVVGCAGLLTPWKGQAVLLEALARLGREDVRVELAGGVFPKDGPYRRALQARAAQVDLAGRVRFLGPVPDTLAVMRHWTVATSPSVDPEAGPLVPLEAMSIGLPLVGTDHGGTPEVLGDAGLLVAPRDPGALGAAILTLLDSEELWWRCHLAGPAQIAAGLTLDRQMASLLGVIDRAAGGVTAGRP